jgi:hypothetical protein
MLGPVKGVRTVFNAKTDSPIRCFSDMVEGTEPPQDNTNRHTFVTLRPEGNPLRISLTAAMALFERASKEVESAGMKLETGPDGPMIRMPLDTVIGKLSAAGHFVPTETEIEIKESGSRWARTQSRQIAKVPGCESLR